MQKIDGIIAKVLEIRESDLDDSMNMDTVSSWDSLRNMELIATLESEFSFELTFDEISDMVSVGKVREIVTKKLQ